MYQLIFSTLINPMESTPRILFGLLVGYLGMPFHLVVKPCTTFFFISRGLLLEFASMSSVRYFANFNFC